jgi:hypothetical protein
MTTGNYLQWFKEAMGHQETKGQLDNRGTDRVAIADRLLRDIIISIQEILAYWTC